MVLDKKIKLHIWDTACQERFRTNTKSYFRDGQGFVLVYDITDRASFLSVKNWIEQFYLNSNPDINIILVANKLDSRGQRVVSYEEGLNITKKYNIDFNECSAKSNI
jgi:small GTP-binding protein